MGRLYNSLHVYICAEAKVKMDESILTGRLHSPLRPPLLLSGQQVLILGLAVLLYDLGMISPQRHFDLFLHALVAEFFFDPATLAVPAGNIANKLWLGI